MSQRPLKVRLPRTLGVTQMVPLLDLIRFVNLHFSDVIQIDGSILEFADPAGLCILSCAGKKWGRAGRRVRFVGLEENLRNYLERMDVFEHCGVQERPSIYRRPRGDTLVEVTCLADRSQVEVTAKRVVETLIGSLPGMEPDECVEGMFVRSEETALTLGLLHVFSELMDNSLTHGRRAGYGHAEVWLSCQYLPRRDILRLAVVDDGCGLLGSLQHHPSVRDVMTHEQALRMAFEPGVSCNKEVGLMGVEARNLGMGLTICHDIANATGGTMWAGSGDRWMRNPRGGLGPMVLPTVQVAYLPDTPVSGIAIKQPLAAAR